MLITTQGGASPKLAVTPPNQNVNTPAGSTNFNVTSNANWTVSSGQTWCTTSSAGFGDGTVMANYTENIAVSPRIATLAVTVSGLPVQNVTVSQDGFVGLNEQRSGEFRIWPNPNKGIFRIVPPPGQSTSLNVTVCDISGQVILKKLIIIK